MFGAYDTIRYPVDNDNYIKYYNDNNQLCDYKTGIFKLI